MSAAGVSAAIVAIGDELVAGEAIDTNSSWLAERLRERGIETRERRTVGDDVAAIARALGELAGRHDVVIATGGLGPTADDLTRFALRDVVAPGTEMVSDRVALDHLASIFSRRGRPMPQSNDVQALRPEPAAWLDNPRGTALGLSARAGDCRVFCLPGPPGEMHGVFDEQVAVQLPRRPDRTLRLELVHAFGLGESAAAERLGALLERDAVPQVGITVSQSTVTARVRGIGSPDEAARMAGATAAEIERRLAPYAFGRGETTLAAAAGAALQRRGRTLVTAESCTGGLLGAMIVSVAGSSAFYRGGWVTYADSFKRDRLGVAPALLERHGAVSPDVARAMAEGALERGGADEALAVTGIAGPDGGAPAKPVGLVFIALASRGGETGVRSFCFPGDRAAVRDRSARCALQMLRFRLEGAGDPELIWETRRPARRRPEART